MNSIKESADGLALQVTIPARDAGLVEENSDGEATHLADVFVYGFDGVLVVVDTAVSTADRAELVASAAGDTDSIHLGAEATLATAGNGYQVQLPGCRQAGFHLDDKAPVRPHDGVLFIHDGTNRRIVEDLVTIRDEQVSN